MLTIDPATLEHPKRELEKRILLLWPTKFLAIPRDVADRVTTFDKQVAAARLAGRAVPILPPIDRRPFWTVQDACASCDGRNVNNAVDWLFATGLVERGLGFDEERFTLKRGGDKMALTPAGEHVRSVLLGRNGTNHVETDNARSLRADASKTDASDPANRIGSDAEAGGNPDGDSHATSGAAGVSGATAAGGPDGRKSWSSVGFGGTRSASSRRAGGELNRSAGSTQ